jgi:hypothetical protein
MDEIMAEKLKVVEPMRRTLPWLLLGKSAKANCPFK